MTKAVVLLVGALFAVPLRADTLIELQAVEGICPTCQIFIPKALKKAGMELCKAGAVNPQINITTGIAVVRVCSDALNLSRLHAILRDEYQRPAGSIKIEATMTFHQGRLVDASGSFYEMKNPKRLAIKPDQLVRISAVWRPNAPRTLEAISVR